MKTNASSTAVDVSENVVRALVLYALAEVQSGNATTLNVEANGTSFSVSDDGRGHAIDRTIDGQPYLPFIYTHLEYPFGRQQSGTVQLQGIGMSLLNVLCSELTVIVRKRTETLHMRYRAGGLTEEARIEETNQTTGNMVFGSIKSDIQRTDTNLRGITQWLSSVVAANPGLRLYFNGVEQHASPRAGAA
jgi:DNA gyrase/topoisomerase IV subunit B